MSAIKQPTTMKARPNAHAPSFRSTKPKSAAPTIDLTSLYNLPYSELTSRLSTMLDQEKLDCYRCTDYLGHYPINTTITQPSSSSTITTTTSRRLTPGARTKITHWLYSIIDHFGLQRETVALSLSYADRFLSRNADHPVAKQCRRNVASFQLLGLACLFLGVKTLDVASSCSPSSAATGKSRSATTPATATGGTAASSCDGCSSADDDGNDGDHHRRHGGCCSSDCACDCHRDKGRRAATTRTTATTTTLDAKLLAKASRGCYTSDEIVEMERVVLEGLEWRVSGGVTACGVACHIIALWRKVLLLRRRYGEGQRRRRHRRDDTDDVEEKIHTLVDFTLLQIELSTAEYSTSVLRSPSSVAIAAVLNSMDLLESDDYFPRGDITAFRKLLRETTGVRVQNAREVEEVRRELIEVFDRRTTEKDQGEDEIEEGHRRRWAKSPVTDAAALATDATTSTTKQTKTHPQSKSKSSGALIVAEQSFSSFATAETSHSRSNYSSLSSSHTKTGTRRRRRTRRSCHLSAPSPTCVDGFVVAAAGMRKTTYPGAVGKYCVFIDKCA
mmetsp:Transcript_26897/g.56466  ORF Transcript_26897/g.56466 Transcript_26897/m.56466 type:complete len:559 (-) Transcript_26897:1096-2772(-)